MKDFLHKLQLSIQNFMRGRRGTDQLSIFLLGVALVAMIISSLTGWWLFSCLAFICIVLCYWRIFSKKLSKREQENFKFLHWCYAIRNFFLRKKSRLQGMKEYKYFKCSQCGQQLRVPRGKGKLTVTCPKCKNEMHKKS